MEIIDVLDNIFKKILLQILGIKEIKCDKKSEIFCWNCWKFQKKTLKMECDITKKLFA